MNNNIILIAGMPGSGKTTLLNALTQHIPGVLPVSIDNIQETLYDTIGFKSPDERRKLKAAAFAIALNMAQNAVDNHLIPILEYPFTQIHGEQLKQTFLQTDFITLRLDLPLSKAYERFHARDLSPARHPGHFYHHYPVCPTDEPHYQTFDSYKAAMERLKVCEFALGKTLSVDATKFPLPLDKILSFVKKHVKLDNCVVRASMLRASKDTRSL